MTFISDVVFWILLFYLSWASYFVITQSRNYIQLIIWQWFGDGLIQITPVSEINIIFKICELLMAMNIISNLIVFNIILVLSLIFCFYLPIDIIISPFYFLHWFSIPIDSRLKVKFSVTSMLELWVLTIVAGTLLLILVYFLTVVNYFTSLFRKNTKVYNKVIYLWLFL